MIPLLLALTLAAAPAEDVALHERLSAQVAEDYDAEKGGFVARKGEPVESAVELALIRAKEDDTQPWMQYANRSMRRVWALYDSVGGGFVHLPAHADPSQPTFEKRTDSNARRLEIFLDSWEVSGSDSVRGRIVQIIDYFDRVLMDGRGGFVEGQFGSRILVPEYNGLAVHAWLRWAHATSNERRQAFALRSLDRMWQQTWDQRYGLIRRNEFGEFVSKPLLVDHVEAGRACLLAARLSGRKVDMQRAVMLGDMIVDLYQDPKKGGFYTRRVPDKNGVTKKAPRDLRENARAARFLCELSWVTGDARYREASRRAWQSFDKKLQKAGVEAAEWALAVRESYVAPEMPAPAAASTARTTSAGR